MMFKLLIAFVLFSMTLSFSPVRFSSRKSSLNMVSDSMQSKISKIVAAAAIGFSLVEPMNAALADGAVSASTIFRARNYYGPKILALESAVNSGNFAAFDDKKVVNAFDLFISATNAQKSAIAKERKSAESALEAKIFSAVKEKDSGKLKSAYSEFIKVADLKSAYKPGELGQTDSSGYSPTWGTDRQYIYQR